jgi:aquaporin Z
VKALVAEFIGTFTLIFIGVGAIAADQLVDGSSGLIGAALAHGLAIGVMVSATAATSGGHLNPAVTFGALVSGKLPVNRALVYWVAQFLGAIAGAFFVSRCFPSDIIAAIQTGTPVLGEGIMVAEGLLTEVILTFFLVFVVFGTGIDPRAPKAGGLFIGLAVTMGILVGGPLTGAAMNPARYLGPALLGGGLENAWLYFVGPLLGGALAGLVYTYLVEQKSGTAA